MQLRIPCTIMRGGTSKGVFFKRQDLPEDEERQNAVILSAFGSPDPYGRQLDGLGGATSVTSKVAIVSPRQGELNTVDYTFGQVSITAAIVDRRGNCGNISSAVGPYAIDEGMVTAQEPETTVRIFNTNTGKYITARVPVEDGKAKFEGTFQIAGVPGMGACISLEFADPGGAVTGKLLPTGRPVNIVESDYGRFEVSIVDAANPVVFVRARDLGLEGPELPDDMLAKPALLSQLESIRAAAAVMIGLASNVEDATRRSPAVPKIALVSASRAYTMTSGLELAGSEFDLTARIMSMGKPHNAYAITGAICTAGAAQIRGTVVHEMIPAGYVPSSEIRIGHPSGVIVVAAQVDVAGVEPKYTMATVFRTARRIMDGYVYVPSQQQGCR